MQSKIQGNYEGTAPRLAAHFFVESTLLFNDSMVGDVIRFIETLRRDIP
ncbi:hypothetical protein [Rhizobium mongolense]|uniref:Uncharacterized protein n=1 Tax=Rhizobium mongolense TaxID=57676 RepID=A0ABR6IVD2_9HYPH|nr:hypothetical protein [Rhizobium mongolense]MBB4231718.1 hypothetical protein [Rhizobium mongolense]